MCILLHVYIYIYMLFLLKTRALIYIYIYYIYICTSTFACTVCMFICRKKQDMCILFGGTFARR